MGAIKSNLIPFVKDLSGLPQDHINKVLVSSGFSGQIDQVNWDAYPYRPKVSFYLAHNNRLLFILYKVNEENTCAKYLKDNDAVWEDSCVEAFFSKDINEGYFNVEVNCIGTALVGFGKERDNRIHLQQDQMKKIKRISSLGRKINNNDTLNGNWWLQITIPFEILGLTKGATVHANFYKCGDKCKVPHFLSWQPIYTPRPDFHQPNFFAKLILENSE